MSKLIPIMTIGLMMFILFSLAQSRGDDGRGGKSHLLIGRFVLLIGVISGFSLSMGAGFTSDENGAPHANDQHFKMRASELLALPIRLAATDPNGEPLDFTIVSEPSHGRLIGKPPRLEYLPENSFHGRDQFTYKAANSIHESNIATVTIDVYQEPCPEISDQALFLHVPSHIVLADISPNHHKVAITGRTLHESASLDPDATGHIPWISRNDMTDKTIEIDLKDVCSSSPLTVSVKMIPSSLDDSRDKIILRSNLFIISERSGYIRCIFQKPDGDKITIDVDNEKLNPYCCNYIAIVIGENTLAIYVNGQPVRDAGEIIEELSGKIVIGPYPGKIWDIRIDKRALTQDEIFDLAGPSCPNNPKVTPPDPEYPNYLCGVYVCEWWPNDTMETPESYRYYLHAQDTVYERNLFEARMYPEGRLFDYIESDPGRHLILGEGIRKTFVRPWSFENPLRQRNGQHWLHENFHSFQGRLARYNRFGGSKFLLESTASWGADHNIPGVGDTLLAYYSMHPHLPLWTIQNSPVDMRAGNEFKGGHQYGAYIFWSYLTQYVTNKGIIGEIFNDRRAGSSPVEVAYELLARQGHDMKLVFGDFAARVTTWDIQYGQQYAASEQASLRRMQRARPDAKTFDNKITTTFDGDGTGDQWVSVPEEYLPGSWAFNAFRVKVDRSVKYHVAIRTDESNPPYSDFQARVVVHNRKTGGRRYHFLRGARTGEISEIEVSANMGEDLYLVVATTPDIFKGWDWYRYEFKIYPAQ